MPDDIGRIDSPVLQRDSDKTNRNNRGGRRKDDKGEQALNPEVTPVNGEIEPDYIGSPPPRLLDIRI